MRSKAVLLCQRLSGRLGSRQCPAVTRIPCIAFSTEVEAPQLSPDYTLDKGNKLTGEDCYKLALNLLKGAKTEQQKEEAKRSEEQYQAWQRAQEQSANPPSKKEGVAVVKTIAKQARRKEQSATQDLQLQALKMLEKAGLEYGHAKALVRLGNAAMEDAKSTSATDVSIIQKHVEKSMRYYEMAGENGSAEGWFNLGHILWTGYPDQSNENDGAIIIDQNQKASMKAFYKAIDLGDEDAMFFVGVQLLSEENDLEQGLHLIEKAASLQHGGALYYLALLHLNGNEQLGICPCETSEFKKRLNAAVDAGDTDAFFLRGHCFYHGQDGYEQNFGQALDDFLAAANAGHSNAAVSAGAMLHQGVGGVERDQGRAFELYQLAGELGNVEGWRNVVACYASGEGVPQCEQTAKYIAKTMLRDN